MNSKMDEPICIFLPGENTDEAKVKLRKLLFRFESENGNHKLVVVSIAGRARLGKSFLLNFFIRYVSLTHA